MKFCEEHWASLRRAIDERGMGDLIAKDGEDAKAKLESQVEGERTVENFEPLMHAHNTILANTIRFVPDVMVMNEDGTHRCPLCYLTKTHKDTCTDPDCKVEDFDGWVEKAADETLEIWEKLKAEADA